MWSRLSMQRAGCLARRGLGCGKKGNLIGDMDILIGATAISCKPDAAHEQQTAL